MCVTDNPAPLNTMPILTIIIVIAITGVLLWLVNTYIPMQAGVKRLLNIAVVIILIVWLLKVCGVLGWLSQVRI